MIGRRSWPSIVLALALAWAVPGRAGAQPAPPYCGPLDVAFAIDDTGSMQQAIDSIKVQLERILDDIETCSNPGTGAGPDYRLALVTFKDDVTVLLPFAPNNRAAFSQALVPVTAFGGGQVPEASDEALNTIVNGLRASGRPQTGDFVPAFRAGARKVIVLVTDAPPGGFDDILDAGDQARAALRAQEAAAAGIVIGAVYVPTREDLLVHETMKMYAETTNGQFIQTPPDGSGTAIRTIVTGCPPANRPPVAVCASASVTADLSGFADASIDGGSFDLDGVIRSLAQAPPGPYPVGNTPVTLTVTDDGGATAACEAAVTVASSWTPPDVGVPHAMVVEATAASGAIVVFQATAADAAGAALVPACHPSSGATFPIGVTTVTCTAADSHGLTGSNAFDVTVSDTTAPALTLPADVTLKGKNSRGATYTFTATAIDRVDGAVAVVCQPSSGSLFPPGTTTVNCRAADSQLNVAQGSFRVTVQRHGHGKSKPPHAKPPAPVKPPARPATKEVHGKDR